jgi:hypothetical protein
MERETGTCTRGADVGWGGGLRSRDRAHGLVEVLRPRRGPGQAVFVARDDRAGQRLWNHTEPSFT